MKPGNELGMKLGSEAPGMSLLETSSFYFVGVSWFTKTLNGNCNEGFPHL